MRPLKARSSIALAGGLDDARRNQRNVVGSNGQHPDLRENTTLKRTLARLQRLKSPSTSE